MDEKNNLEEVIFLEMRKVVDERGFLSILFEEKILNDAGINFKIVQVNTAYSPKKYTMRGCHFQEVPYEQAKLVSCIKGSIFSVAIDIRKDSPTFGKWKGQIISSRDSVVMYIPKGFAHGYVTLDDETIMQWCVDEAYIPNLNKSIKYDDPDISIIWPIDISNIIISQKDKNALFLYQI